ncbi:hypothetical protein L0Y49_01640 [bacterium]|nr:hypothetical protein [bacterium]MCI0565756.1 hypothetical protein [bacterium]
MSPAAHIDIIINPVIIWAALALSLLFFAAATVALAYHWVKYGQSAKVVSAALLVYGIGSVAIFIVIWSSAFYYLAST